MVRANSRKSGSVQVDYLINIQEINPWPPSQSLKSLRSVFIQWQNGDRRSGTTSPVVPSVAKIVFNESFRLRVNLLVSEGSGTFRKNILEFSLYESRSDDKSQLLATGNLDFADYGVVKNTLSINAPMNSKRSFSKNRPILYLKVLPVYKGGGSNTTSINYNLSKEACLSKNIIGESVSTLMNEEHAKEAEFASFMDNDDDDDESQSSVSVASSSFKSNGAEPLQNQQVLTGTSSPTSSENKAEDARIISGFFRTNEKTDAKIHRKDCRSSIGDSKVRQLENKVKMLEGELREAAGIEASIYSVAAEHGNSMNKIHAPARRLSRLYLYACKESYQPRKASAARNAVSGLVLVAKACGNDVPKLTFWLSNSIVLRAIVSQTAYGPELPRSSGLPTERSRGGKEKTNISSSSKWNDNRQHSLSDWEDPHSFISALKMFEAWIFNRIVESIWWQILTPHMQSAATKAFDNSVNYTGRKKSYRRKSSSGDKKQENLISLELWKQAYTDACERICPVRAVGHACGCLPVLARLVMEQCIARLDVAMFNAILRESADEIPTDPVSDPISDSKVLPIQGGKASFGAGVQLKNVIGNWSRWLTNLFGLDDDDALKDENEYGYNDERKSTSFKSFHLLNDLSDLMMLPKDLLLSASVRKEVCPAFGAPLIKRVLDKFVPDEFCPDPIPGVVHEALESKDAFEAEENTIVNFPCTAAAPVYSPPSVASIACIFGEETGGHMLLRRSGSSVNTKSYTSDDELDELNSPLASILTGKSRDSSSVEGKPSSRRKENGHQNCVRYELLRDVWMNNE
ncbi:hypothetical protein ACFE04_007657 [Oxalis oulophora]